MRLSSFRPDVMRRSSCSTQEHVPSLPPWTLCKYFEQSLGAAGYNWLWFLSGCTVNYFLMGQVFSLFNSKQEQFCKRRIVTFPKGHASALKPIVILFLRLVNHPWVHRVFLSVNRYFKHHWINVIEVKWQSCLNWSSQALLEPSSHLDNSINGTGTSTWHMWCFQNWKITQYWIFSGWNICRICWHEPDPVF